MARSILVSFARVGLILVSLGTVFGAYRAVVRPGRPVVTVSSLPASVVGKVIDVKDGDTLVLLDDRVSVAIRVYGIDAPEKGQAFGDKARESLKGYALGNMCSVYRVGESYDREVGQVICNGVDVGLAVVASGYAWADQDYLSKSPALFGAYVAAHRDAQLGRIGLWSEVPVAPWEWRAQRALDRAKEKTARQM